MNQFYFTDLYPTTTAGKWCATFAMLMGVLVVAFPVSVFSDLWSHELKQIKGFHALGEDDTDDQQAHPQGPGESPSPHRLPRQYHATDSDVVVMDKQDLREIAECLYSIRQNERQLKAILRKYHHEDQF
jgi:hypothetical protein